VLSVAHNIPEIKDKLKRLIRLVDGGWQKDVVRLIERTQKRITKATPRSKGQAAGGSQGIRFIKKFGGHLADGWTMKIIGGSAKDRVPIFGVIWNKNTHDQNGVMKAQLPKASGGVGEYTLLEVLEYGSKPHVITPKNAKALRFISREGEVVFTKRVNHPGTPAFGMVRLTRVWMTWAGKKLQAKWRRKLDQEWAR
jgi:hypothetical protein